LKRLQRRLGITTVFVTHDQQEAMTIADRLAVLDQGVIQQVGAPRSLRPPVNRLSLQFRLDQFGRIERADGERCAIAVDGIGRAEVPAGRVPAGLVRAGAAVAVAFRPHALRPVAASAPPGAGLAFDATIGSVEFLGEFVRYELAIGAHRALADLPHARFAETLVPGAGARFAVPADEFRLRRLAMISGSCFRTTICRQASTPTTFATD
jgi:iron(III) transport system ATP-binding protein